MFVGTGGGVVTDFDVVIEAREDTLEVGEEAGAVDSGRPDYHINTLRLVLNLVGPTTSCDRLSYREVEFTDL